MSFAKKWFPFLKADKAKREPDKSDMDIETV